MGTGNLSPCLTWMLRSHRMGRMDRASYIFLVIVAGCFALFGNSVCNQLGSLFYRLFHKLLNFLVKITSEYHKFGLVNYAILFTLNRVTPIRNRQIVMSSRDACHWQVSFVCHTMTT